MGLFSTGDSSVDDQQNGLTGIFSSVVNNAVNRLLPNGAVSSNARATVANPPLQGGVTNAQTVSPGTSMSPWQVWARKPIVIIGGVVAVAGLLWVLIRKRR